MVQIAPVTLQYNPKTLWFSPNGQDIHEGDCVVVSTERGTEFGYAGDVCEVSDEAVAKLKELKPVLRVATEEDKIRAEELRRMGAEALPVFKRLAAEANGDMHPVMVEYLFDGDKAVFYFEAEERIDFRELVRQLAAEFHVRVDMRQIGVRDEARLVGGLGHCGQELCCRRLGGEFCPVSIRMAKEQDLSLNPQKISGVCGRLMCCLRYEYEAYKDFKSRAPKVNAKIDTPAGPAKVVDLDVPRETVKLRLEEDGKNVVVPLSAMDEPPEGSNRPNSIGEAFEEYANPDPFVSGGNRLFDTTAFTREDKLATPEARRSTAQTPARTEGEEAQKQPSQGRSRRRRRGGKKLSSGASAQAAQGQQARASQDGVQDARAAQGDGKKREEGKSRNQRRRRQHKVANDVSAEQAQAQEKNKQRQQKVQNQKAQNQRKRSQVRPGQKSSGLRAAQPQAGPAPESEKPASKQTPAAQHRRSRRRSHKTGGSSDEA